MKCLNLRFFFSLLVYCFIFFIGFKVNAETVSGTASVGRQSILDTSNNYYYTDWKLLSSNSLNSISVGSIYSGDSFYLMGSEYSFPISLTGQTNFAVTVRVPVSANTIYTYQETDGLSQSDFRVGISPNFAVYNITPTITSFNRAKGVYARNGVAHVYMYYDVVFNFTLSEPLTGAYNLNFSVMNLSANRSSYYLSGGNSGVSLEFPVGYFSGQSEPDAVLFSMMSPTVSMSYGTTADNQDIIDANNENTQLIISNQNENTEALQETIEQSYEDLVNSQQVCSTIDIFNYGLYRGWLNSDGVFNSNENLSYLVSDYISISSSDSLSVSQQATFPLCFYNANKTKISCLDSLSVGSLSIPSNASYFRLNFRENNNIPVLQLCRNGNQAINDTITDSSIDTHSANSFFESMDFFEDATLSSVITAPLDFINSLDNGCSPIVLTYRGQSITLPCGDTIFWNREDVSTFRAFWNALFGGLIIYRLVRRLFIVVEQAMNPEDTNTLGGLDL